MRRQEREIREKEKRRRKRKSCLRTFLTISFIVVATVLLNGMAALVVWQAFGGLPRPSVHDSADFGCPAGLPAELS